MDSTDGGSAEPRIVLPGGIAADQVSLARGNQRYWTKVDYRAFTSALLVEGHSRRLRMSPDVPFDRRQPIADQIQELLATFREALPYSEAERRWLVDIDKQFEPRRVLLDPDERGWQRPVPAPVEEQLIDLNAAKGEIVSAGLHQVVQGRELAWRRQTEEFTDEGSREIAYEALRGLGHMLVPNRAEAEQAGIPTVYMPPRL